MFASGRNELERIGGRARQERVESTALINVTMEDAAVVVRPVGRLDPDTMATVSELLASAAAAGTAAVLDVTGVDPRDRARADELLAAIPPVTRATVA